MLYCFQWFAVTVSFITYACPKEFGINVKNCSGSVVQGLAHLARTKKAWVQIPDG